MSLTKMQDLQVNLLSHKFSKVYTFLFHAFAHALTTTSTSTLLFTQLTLTYPLKVSLNVTSSKKPFPDSYPQLQTAGHVKYFFLLIILVLIFVTAQMTLYYYYTKCNVMCSPNPIPFPPRHTVRLYFSAFSTVGKDYGLSPAKGMEEIFTFQKSNLLPSLFSLICQLDAHIWVPT